MLTGDVDGQGWFRGTRAPFAHPTRPLPAVVRVALGELGIIPIMLPPEGFEFRRPVEFVDGFLHHLYMVSARSGVGLHPCQRSIERSFITGSFLSHLTNPIVYREGCRRAQALAPPPGCYEAHGRHGRDSHEQGPRQSPYSERHPPHAT